MNPITHTVADRTDEGSCNNCQTRADSKVLVISLKNMSFRVCSDCAVQLRTLLCSAVSTREFLPVCATLPGDMQVITTGTKTIMSRTKGGAWISPDGRSFGTMGVTRALRFVSSKQHLKS